MNHFNLQHAASKGSARLAACVLAGVLGPMNLAIGQAPPPGTYTFDTGVACPFPLSLTIQGQQQVSREFVDKNGNTVRYLFAGRGTTNTYTNTQTGASITIKPSGGSVLRGTQNPDGTFTYVGTGFNGLIFYPSDVPAGPSTTLYIGRVVYTVDPTTGVFTLVGSSGKQTDICATLSPTAPN